MKDEINWRQAIIVGEKGRDNYCVTFPLYTNSVGGNPPTLDSPLLRGDHLSYTTDQGLMDGRCFLQELLSYSPQVVSSEVSLVTKKAMAGRIVDAPFVPQGGKFDATDIVGYLKEMVVAWSGVSIDCGMLGEAVSNCLVDGMLNNLLTIVIVDLHAVKALEESKLGVNELHEVSFDTPGKVIRTWKLALLIAQDLVMIGSPLCEDVEVGEMALSGIERHRIVLIVSAHDWCEVEWYGAKSRIRQASHVFLDTLANILALLVEYECNQIKGGAVADISRLVYGDIKLSHRAAPSIIKMPRDTPRLRDSPPCMESHIFCTTSRSAESIVCEPEHKFVTIEANTCSTYREAA